MLKITTYLLLFLTITFTNLTSNFAYAADARKIMETVYSQDNSRDTSWQAIMEVFDKKGNIRKKKFSFKKIGGLGKSKTLVRFIDPQEVRGTGLLSHNYKGQNERQWLYTPAIQRTRRIAPQERSGRFMGTDFTHEDMAERVFEDFEYKILSEGEIIDGHKTFKIEARPVSPDKSQYTMLYLWIPQDIPYVVFIEMYDKKKQKIRAYHASNLVKISNIWLAQRIEMTSLLDKTKTVLNINDVKFNTNFKEDLFTLQSLEQTDLF